MPTESATYQATSPPRPVRMWFRILAWIIVIGGILPIGLTIYNILARDVWPTDIWPTGASAIVFRIIQVAAVIWLFPLFVFVAIKGRPPLKWPGIRSAALQARR